MITRKIPSTDEELPVIGLGTWQVLDVQDEEKFPELKNVLQTLHDGGGRLIDTSPMYGRSETAIGKLTTGLLIKDDFFYATKVWTEGREAGIRQMEDSMQKMARTSLDLIQVHNLVDWKTHLRTLRQWKDEGRVRYIGFTHYTDSMHEALADIIRKEPLDFVQFNYSITDRHAQQMLLPLCHEKGVATIINRPLGQGQLMRQAKNKTLPEFAEELGISSWGQYFLKFIISHPAVTCVIPATSSSSHMRDNAASGDGYLPDDAMREQMAAVVNNW